MTGLPDFASRVRAVKQAKAASFTELVQLAGLDPATSFRFSDLSGVDLSNQDLTGYNFTGADLRGCSWRGAVVRGVDFTDAEIDGEAQAELEIALDLDAAMKRDLAKADLWKAVHGRDFISQMSRHGISHRDYGLVEEMIDDRSHPFGDAVALFREWPFILPAGRYGSIFALIDRAGDGKELDFLVAIAAEAYGGLPQKLQLQFLRSSRNFEEGLSIALSMDARVALTAPALRMLGRMATVVPQLDLMIPLMPASIGDRSTQASAIRNAPNFDLAWQYANSKRDEFGYLPVELLEALCTKVTTSSDGAKVLHETIGEAKASVHLLTDEIFRNLSFAECLKVIPVLSEFELGLNLGALRTLLRKARSFSRKIYVLDLAQKLGIMPDRFVDILFSVGRGTFDMIKMAQYLSMNGLMSGYVREVLANLDIPAVVFEYGARFSD